MIREELIERLGKATGPDRKLDGDVAEAFGWSRPKIKGFCGDGYVGRRDYEWHDENGSAVGFYVCRYTESLDAAVALVERILPGVWYHLAKGKTRADEPMYGASLLFGEKEVLGQGESDANQAIAILIALLRADPTP